MSQIKTKMHRVRCDFRNKNAVQMHSKALVVLSRMQNNEHFAEPNPYLVKLTESTATLGYILQMPESPLQLTKRHQAQKELTIAMRCMAAYVQAVSEGSEEVILSTGFDVRRKRTKRQLPQAPLIKRIDKMDIRGCVKLLCEADTTTRLYRVYVTKHNQPEAKTVEFVSTRSSLVVKGLESGVKYDFQVSALNTAGSSPRSTPLTTVEAWM